MSKIVRVCGNEFVTELSNAQLTMIIEALDYAVLQARTSCIEVFGGFETAEDGADEAAAISKQLLIAQDKSDKGTIIINY